MSSKKFEVKIGDYVKFEEIDSHWSRTFKGPIVEVHETGEVVAMVDDVFDSTSGRRVIEDMKKPLIGDEVKLNSYNILDVRPRGISNRISVK